MLSLFLSTLRSSSSSSAEESGSPFLTQNRSSCALSTRPFPRTSSNSNIVSLCDWVSADYDKVSSESRQLVFIGRRELEECPDALSSPVRVELEKAELVFLVSPHSFLHEVLEVWLEGDDQVDEVAVADGAVLVCVESCEYRRYGSSSAGATRK